MNASVEQGMDSHSGPMGGSSFGNYQREQAGMSSTLWVGNLADTVKEGDLHDVFIKCGLIQSIKIPRDMEQRSQGYAYVNFLQPSSAEQALDTLCYTVLHGKELTVQRSERNPEGRMTGQGNIVVANLAKSIDSKGLHARFSVYGTIQSCKLETDTATGQSRGYGFVHFVKPEAAARAVSQMNGLEVEGQVLKVSHFVPAAARKKETSYEDGCPKHFTNVYIKNLPPQGVEAVQKLFADCGPVTSFSHVQNAKGVVAYCNFEVHADAKKAVDSYNGARVNADGAVLALGKGEEEPEKREEEDAGEFTLYVQPFQNRDRRHKLLKRQHQGSQTGKVVHATCYIKHFPEQWTEQDFHTLFGKYGHIVSCAIKTDKTTGVSLGQAWLTFSEATAAADAIAALHKSPWEGKPLYVALHEDKATRAARLMEQHRNSRLPFGPPMRPFLPSQQAFPGFMPAPHPVLTGYPAAPFARPMRPQPMNQRLVPNQMPRPYPHRLPTKDAGAANLVLELELSVKNMPPKEAKQTIGDHLLAMVRKCDAPNARKITGMMLEMENKDIFALMKDPALLVAKIREANDVLQGDDQEA